LLLLLRQDTIMSSPEPRIATRPSDLIGNTPLIDLQKILTEEGVDGEVNLSSI